MRAFKNREEYDLLIASFEEKAKSLGEDVSFETKTIQSEGEESGEVYVAYIRKPNLLASVKAMDMVSQRQSFGAGLMLFPVCFIAKDSDLEFETKDSWKMGICGKLGMGIEIDFPDIKKK
jgi:hypothetical protein